MSQPAQNTGKRKFSPDQAESSATNNTKRGIESGQDVGFNDLAPRWKRVRIAIDRHRDQVNDHHPDLDNEGCPLPNNFIVPIHSMNRLQERRDDEITPRSMVSALLWDQAQLSQPDVATVVNLDDWAIFEQPQADFDQAGLSMKAAGNVADEENAENSCFVYHDLFACMRQAEYIFWPYQFRYSQTQGDTPQDSKGTWVLIVMRVEGVELVTGTNDRYVSEIAIIDPEASQRQDRRQAIRARLPVLLQQYAHMTVDRNSWWAMDHDDALQAPVLQPGRPWSTGHVCYQHAHELFRRLRCLLHAGQRGRHVASFWRPLREAYDPDLARKLMLAACALRAVEKSEYYGRLAIEFPGFAGGAQDARNYQPSELDPRDAEAKQFDAYTGAMIRAAQIVNAPHTIGLWSLHLDADQRDKGLWKYIRARGEFAPGSRPTRDEARYQYLVTGDGNLT